MENYLHNNKHRHLPPKCFSCPSIQWEHWDDLEGTNPCFRPSDHELQVTQVTTKWASLPPEHISAVIPSVQAENNTSIPHWCGTLGSPSSGCSTVKSPHSAEKQLITGMIQQCWFCFYKFLSPCECLKDSHFHSITHPNRGEKEPRPSLQNPAHEALPKHEFNFYSCAKSDQTVH